MFLTTHIFKRLKEKAGFPPPSLLLADNRIDGKPEASTCHDDTDNPIAALPHVLDKTEHGEEDEKEGKGNGDGSAGDVGHC